MSNIKEKLDKLNATIAHLKATQTWHLEQGRCKSPIVKTNIEYASALREYLMTDTVKDHLGRLDGVYKFPNDVERCYLIEDSNNRSVRSFVRKMNMLVFDNFRDMDEFRTLPVRTAK